MTAYVFDRRDPKRLLIGSDTLGYTPGERPKPLGFSGKVIPVPHLRGVLCGRGMMAIGVSAAAHLMAEPSVVTFVDVLEVLPPILTRCTADYAVQYYIPDPDSLMLYECIWAGWNDGEGRMEVVAFRNYEQYKPIRGDAKSTVSAIPELPREYVPANLAGAAPDRMIVELMKAERRYLAEHPDVVPAIIGGEVVITEITPNGISSRIVHQFEDFAQMRHAAAAVRGRILRGDDDVSFDGICRVDDAIEDQPGMTRAERRRQEKLARKGRRAA